MPTNRTCSIDDCTRPHLARGFCSMHWQRWKAEGFPGYTDPYGTLSERFFRNVPTLPPEECWEWTGARNGGRSSRIPTYGILTNRERNGSHMLMAHRVSWEIHNGSIPAGLLVCHHCDNPPCVNPSHLFLGTPQDNILDALRKGRIGNRPPPRLPLTTHCYRGHERTEKNTHIESNGAQRCRPCHAINEAARRQRAKAGT